MFAVGFRKFGGPEVLETIELPQPHPGEGEIIVRVAAATINPTDVMMREGKQAAAMVELSPPFVAGMEFAGRVHEVGPGVLLEPGQPVMCAVNPRRPQGGAQAEYVCVPAASAAVLAPEDDLVEAATVPMNGLTAKFALRMLELPEGGTVLVTGGTGAVGGYVLQLAKRCGYVSIATGHAEDEALLRQLGADHIVSRDSEMGAAVRALSPNGVDGLIDAALLGDAAAALVRDGGGAVALRSSNPITDPRLRNQVVMVGKHMTDQAALTELAEELRTGVIVPRVAATFPITKAQDAYRRVEAGGFRGRVVLTFGDV